MLPVVLAANHTTGLGLGLVATAFGFGFRHGIDWDHIAAITDITGSQDDRRRSLAFATLYAAGHGLVVFLLGLGAIVLSARLPDSVDTVMEHVVGATLVALGVYVAVALVRNGRDFRMRSRWMLVFAGVRRGWRRLRPRPPSPAQTVVVAHDHEHDAVHHGAHVAVPALVGAPAPGGHRHGHRHVGQLPDDPFVDYGRATAFGVGMLHGVGAETPTQVLIFLAAAGAGGRAVGIAVLATFLAGLLVSNSLIALAGTFGFVGAQRNWRLYVGISIATATFSLVIGTLFLLGRGTALPALFGG